MKKFRNALLVLSFCSLVSCGGSPAISEKDNSSDSETTSEVSSVINNENTSSQEVVDDGVKQVLYVSPTAKILEGDGSKENPMRLVDAIETSKKGATILLMDGTYTFYDVISINSNTEKYKPTKESEMKTLKAINALKVKFDFSHMAFSSSNRGLTLNSDYWHVYGIEVYGAGDNGIYIGGNHNIVENCVLHDCRDTGLQLGRASSSNESIETWPSYNLIKNCTSYDNHDPSGEDSDGFACKLTTGVGNVFDGCIAYNNVDDGWDLYTKGDSGAIGPVTLRNCVAFNNGITTGQNTDGVPYGTANSDGNGFKLGGEVISVQHQVYNCVAFNNLACGFTDNSNPGTIRMENCTSYNNGARDNDASNFDMCRNEDTSNNYFKNLISYSNRNYDFYLDADKSFNSKDQYKGTAVDSIFYYGKTMLKFEGTEECNYRNDALRGTLIEEECPFVSVTAPSKFDNIHEVFRDKDYNVNLGDFLKVKDEFVKANFENTSLTLGAKLG